jgi:hypothetical protein
MHSIAVTIACIFVLRTIPKCRKAQRSTAAQLQVSRLKTLEAIDVRTNFDIFHLLIFVTYVNKLHNDGRVAVLAELEERPVPVVIVHRYGRPESDFVSLLYRTHSLYHLLCSVPWMAHQCPVRESGFMRLDGGVGQRGCLDVGRGLRQPGLLAAQVQLHNPLSAETTAMAVRLPCCT